MQADIFEFAITDYQNVISLWKNCEGIGLSRADSKDSMEAYLKRNPGMSFVAIYQNEIIGAVLCGHDGRRGIQKCHLFIFDSNLEGIRFWEKIGWIRREDIGVVSKEIDFKKLGDADR
jgi:hypothetical protein